MCVCVKLDLCLCVFVREGEHESGEKCTCDGCGSGGVKTVCEKACCA